jgi:fructosamine-3-kinase
MSFVKHNNTNHPDQLLCEAAGLAALQQQLQSIDSPIRIPGVLAVNEQQLTLERIDAVAGSRQQWLNFGQHLAAFHQCRHPRCGWSDDNYIGLNPQSNGWYDDWGGFFYQQRLLAQVNMIKDPDLRTRYRQLLAGCQQPLIDCLNHTTSHLTLLHGDLWSGNVLFDSQSAWLIDPAVYCGDPEADLAMTELFGGFPGVFYQGYRTVRPLTADYALKKIIYNLYHQINHLNLFGSGYRSSCDRAFAIINEQFTS